METEILIARNLVAYSLQLMLLLGVGLFSVRLLRLSDARIMLRYWQGLLVALLALPLLQLLPGGGINAVPAGTAEVWLTGQSTLGASPLPWLSISKFLLFIVVVGASVRLLWFALGAIALARYVEAARPLTVSSSVVRDMAARLDCRAALLLSDQVDQPMTFGWLRPTVLLPGDFLAKHPEEQRAVICHELLHVKRRDWLSTLLEEAVRTVLWFHPAVWCLLARLELAREQVIDGQVLQITRARRVYLDLLLSYAQAERKVECVPATTFLRADFLEERVRAMLAPPTRSIGRLAVVTVCLLLLSGLAAGLAARSFPLRGWEGGDTALATPEVSSPAIYTVEGSVVPPARLGGTPPLYTRAAREAGIEGFVILRAVIGANGKVTEVQPIQGLSHGLTESAAAAISDWEFEPARLNGRAVSVYYNLTVNFRLK